MIESAFRAFFHALAGSDLVKRLAARYGMRGRRGFARRFIAGETLDEAIAAARTIEGRTMTVTLDYLGESVATLDEASRATAIYLDMIGHVAEAGISRNISLKLTQLGLDVDVAACTANLRRILEAARPFDYFVRIDMESSAHVQRTLDVFETLWHDGFRNVGTVIQAYLYRSEADLARMNELGARVRLVKGAYNEPKTVAFQEPGEIKTAFGGLMERLLLDGRYPAIATHDPELIDATTAFAERRAIPRDRFEFQMLYGIRRDLQTSLSARGYRFRVYVPFGSEWFPYFMRRLGERPANVLFVLGSLVSERTRPRRG